MWRSTETLGPQRRGAVVMGTNCLRGDEDVLRLPTVTAALIH